MPQTIVAEKKDIPPFIADGKKLAKAQLLANALAQKLISGNFWSAEDLKKILEKSIREIDEITH